MPRTVSPVAPRVSAPDLPTRLEDGDRPARGGDHCQQRWTALDSETDAAHASITECAFSDASVDRLDLTGATLVDVEIGELRAPAVHARGARLRRVRITGGRLGTLDLGDADVDEVELRGIRIDYLALAGARIQDLVIAGCTIGALDLPQAAVSRTAFVDSRADDVDTRAMRAKDLDLRGLVPRRLGAARRHPVAASGRASRAGAGGCTGDPGSGLTRRSAQRPVVNKSGEVARIGAFERPDIAIS